MLTEKEKTQIYQQVALTKDSTMIHLHFLEVLMAIHEELVKIREATEQANEEEEGATHLGDMSHTFTPGATLNGP